MKILTIQDKKEKEFLKKKTRLFDFSKFSRKEIGDLVKNMKEIMIAANGVGLAANQVGLDFNLFVAQSPRVESSSDYKFYAIFNSEIIKNSEGKNKMDEGCLSVPGGIYGEVERSSRITIVGFDKNGKKIKIKAWGFLARIFQHEVDHLNGVLYIDKAKTIQKIESREQNLE